MTLPPQETCWQAVVDSNAQYDGHFVVAVKTTGIFCRPSCPARTPLRKNVDFFQNPTAAKAAGFRACKRCNPIEVAPVDEQAQRVQAICDYIDAHLDDDLSLETLSAVVYWSPFHLQRTFKQVMGITPRQYAQAQRMAHFKARLQDGARVTDAALDAGFNSTSQLYAHTDAHMGMTPSAYQKGGKQLQIFYSVVESESPLGYLLIAMTERGVCRLCMGDDADELTQALRDEFPEADIDRDDDYLGEAMTQVLAYLRSWQPHLELPLDLRVTAFQQRVLDELKRIPYGETRTYGEIAAAIGKPKAARAVGRACATNPVPLILPCHRVLGSDGKLTGYAFGTERKKFLLDLEENGQGSASD